MKKKSHIIYSEIYSYDQYAKEELKEERVSTVYTPKRFIIFRDNFLIAKNINREEGKDFYYIVPSNVQPYYLAFWFNSVVGVSVLFGTDIEPGQSLPLTKKRLSSAVMPIISDEVERTCIFIEQQLENLKKQKKDDVRYWELKIILLKQIRDAACLEIYIPKFFESHKIDILRSLAECVKIWSKKNYNLDLIFIDLMDPNNKLMNNIKLMNLEIKKNTF